MESIARELADSVYADLFGTRVREDGGRISKFDSYMGRGSLEGWVRRIAVRAGLRLLRRRRWLAGRGCR